jgi:uncharacterized MAPEG superfamily protein
MTTDLWMLVASAGLAWLLIVVGATPNIFTKGPVWAAGNRDDPPTPEGWHSRLLKTSANMQENLPLFAILVLVLHVSSSANDLTATGSIVFFAGRVAHAAIYIAGIAWLRTAAWTVSIVGMGMMISALLT